jgi:ketosteroid isomerase-like protein
MIRNRLIGLMCVYATALGMAAGAAPPDLASFPDVSPNSSLESAPRSGGKAHASVLTAHSAYGRALLSHDADTLAALYLDDALSLPDQQPALFGKPQIRSWYAQLQSRRRVTAYEPKVREVFDFGDTLVESGDFTIGWSLANGQAETAEGKYLHVWAKAPDGTLRLKADVRNWMQPPADSRAFFVDLPVAAPPPLPETKLGSELKLLNERNAAGVRTHDLEARLSFYDDDTILMPHNTTPKIGMKEIRPYLTAYVENGRGATFDKVAVWTQAYQELGGRYGLEYYKFHVDWRAGNDAGTVTGGGIRLWRRALNGELKMLREIGTHDYRP